MYTSINLVLLVKKNVMYILFTVFDIIYSVYLYLTRYDYIHTVPRIVNAKYVRVHEH